MTGHGSNQLASWSARLQNWKQQHVATALRAPRGTPRKTAEFQFNQKRFFHFCHSAFLVTALETQSFLWPLCQLRADPARCVQPTQSNLQHDKGDD